MSFSVNWAEVFVLAAWVLFSITIFYTVRFYIWKAVYDGYGINGRRDVWPMHATLLRLLPTATVLSFGVALFASLTPHRAIGSTAVIGVWVAIAMGSAIAIALTPKGPQELFERSVGNASFLMPNRYRPPNERSGGGFAFIVCLDPFDEDDRALWREAAYISVRTLQEGLAYVSGADTPPISNYVSAIKEWKDNRHKMKPLEPVFGHDQFEFTRQLHDDPNRAVTVFYFVRHDGERLARLARCYERSSDSKCEQYTFSEDRLLTIDSRMWALEHWVDVERNLEGLLACWRVNQSPEYRSSFQGSPRL